MDPSHAIVPITSGGLKGVDVRFGFKSGLMQCSDACPLWAINVRFASRRTAAKFASLFDEARRRRTRYSELDYSGKLRAMASALISTVRKASQPSAGQIGDQYPQIKTGEAHRAPPPLSLNRFSAAV